MGGSGGLQDNHISDTNALLNKDFSTATNDASGKAQLAFGI